MLELLIIRHGMSVRNHYTDLAFEGDTSLLDEHMVTGKDEAAWPLWADGETQARETGEWLKHQFEGAFAAAYTSPFVRAQQTADLLQLDNVEWITDARIRERYWGEYGPETNPLYTTQEYMGDIHRCGHPTWRTRLPRGEAVIDLYPMAEEFLREAFSKNPDGRIVLVTHGGTMRAMQMVLDGISLDSPERLERVRTDNCSVMRYRQNGSTWKRELVTPWLDPSPLP